MRSGGLEARASAEQISIISNIVTIIIIIIISSISVNVNIIIVIIIVVINIIIWSAEQISLQLLM